MTDAPREFQFGLVMAGAISAGAYTAGVMDYLLEALEAWQTAKENTPDLVPNHATRLRALSAASAGAMVGAILARALATGVTPVEDVAAPPDIPDPDPARQRAPYRNPFFAAWVQNIDLRHLLGLRDLASPEAKVVSVLDSTVLGEIGRNVLVPPGPSRERRPRFLAKPFDIFLTTVNLRGVPYGFGFSGQATGYLHKMTAYADQRHFTLTWPNEGADAPNPGAVDICPVPLDATRVGPDGAWQALMDSALASGAFPIGLAPRVLTRKATDYDERLWPVPEGEPLTTLPRAGDVPVQVARCSRLEEIPPCWPDGIRNPDPAKTGADPAYDYTYWNVDGGLMNNEPLELVRRVLAEGGRNARAGDEADRAVVMVDPFPNGSDVGKDYNLDIDLIKIVQRMFGALKEQARFKPDDLELAAAPEVYSRFVVSPIYSGGAGPIKGPDMASAIMGGFGGFFCEAFRRHDFQLGRRNCQRFLQRYFVLPLDNPLFDGWRYDPVRVARYSYADDDPNFPGRRLVPIIPLMDALDPAKTPAAEVPPPVRPRAADVDLEALRERVKERANLVGPRVMSSLPLSAAVRWLVWKAAIALGLRRKMVDAIMAKIEQEVDKLG